MFENGADVIVAVVVPSDGYAIAYRGVVEASDDIGVRVLVHEYQVESLTWIPEGRPVIQFFPWQRVHSIVESRGEGFREYNVR